MGRFSNLSPKQRRAPRTYTSLRNRSVAITRIHNADPSVNYFTGEVLMVWSDWHKREVPLYTLEFHHAVLEFGTVFVQPGLRADGYNGPLS